MSGQLDPKIASLIAAEIDQYKDRLYTLAVSACARAVRIEFLPPENSNAGTAVLPSEQVGIPQNTGDAAESQVDDSPESRMIISRISLENISAADTAVADPEFLQALLKAARHHFARPFPS